MKIIILGANGQLGMSLKKIFQQIMFLMIFQKIPIRKMIKKTQQEYMAKQNLMEKIRF